MNHEGDIECMADVGPFGECHCPCCVDAGVRPKRTTQEIQYSQQRRESERRRANLFSPMSLYQQMKDWKK